MRFTKIITTIDSHTAGEPTRVVIGGIPNVPGSTIVEKMNYMKTKLDYIRSTIMNEPRGHSNMFGAIIFPPTTDKADFGVLYMSSFGYLDMCGHGSIGVVTVLIETGMVEPIEPLTNVTLDTPAGLVFSQAEVKERCVKRVTIRNVPSFHYGSDIPVNVPGLGELLVDIAFGGNFFAIIDARKLGIDLNSIEINELIKYGVRIKKSINKQVKVKHPEKEHIRKVEGVLINDVPAHPEANCRNIATGNGIDRSPCGTGTCAKMASLYAKGELGLNEEFITESILNTLFKGKLIKEVKVGNFKAVVPEITGTAYITGINQFVIDPEDPFKHGFKLVNNR